MARALYQTVLPDFGTILQSIKKGVLSHLTHCMQTKVGMCFPDKSLSKSNSPTAARYHNKQNTYGIFAMVANDDPHFEGQRCKYNTAVRSMHLAPRV